MLSRFSCVHLFSIPWTVANQAPLSLGVSRQEYWRGLLCPPSGALPDPGIKLRSLYLLHWQAGSLPLAQPGTGLQISSPSGTGPFAFNVVFCWTEILNFLFFFPAVPFGLWGWTEATAVRAPNPDHWAYRELPEIVNFNEDQLINLFYLANLLINLLIFYIMVSTFGALFKKFCPLIVLKSVWIIKDFQ